MSKNATALEKLKAGYRLPGRAMHGTGETDEMVPPDSMSLDGWAPRRIFDFRTGKDIGQLCSAPPATSAPRTATAPAPKPTGRTVKPGHIITLPTGQFCATIPQGADAGSFVCSKCRKTTQQAVGAVQWATWSPSIQQRLCTSCASTFGLTSTAPK